ncbi:MAG: glycosyltransferase family 2 protein [Clostridiales bacterium]|nr:glycosyltransferase family 2 protein [Clostridiales bacterium]
MKISACWIVKNEAQQLKASIMSVRECAQELIVVDTGSTDQTVSVAKECGAKVFHFEWISDFSAARNYALSLAKGEFVIFLDGDEYFYPALKAADRDNLVKQFEETKADVFGLSSIEIEKESGNVMDLCIRERLLRRKAVHYKGRIHEGTVLENGEHPYSVLLNNYAMVHTGYSRSVVMEKIKRNLEILEEEHETLDDPLRRYLNAIYLTREAFFLNDLDKASHYCLYVFAHHEHLADAIAFSPMGFLRHYYHAADVAALKREKFSRKEVYSKLFKVIKNRFAKSRDGMLADLHYQLRFKYRDDIFFREFKEIEPKLPMEFSLEIQNRRLVEASIYEQASEIAHMRGDRKASCLYAYRALECAPELDGRAMLLLLYSLKDHSVKDAETILKSAAVPGRPDIATTTLTILESKDYRKQLFDNAAMPETIMPKTSHSSVVGAQETDGAMNFRNKAEKNMASMNYADIVNDTDAAVAAKRDYISAYYFSYALIMQERYAEAYNTAAPHVKRGLTNQELLSIISVAAEKTTGSLAAEAKKLYEESIAILNETVDLNDVINTGSVFEAAPKKEKRALKNITPPVFKKEYENDKKRPVTKLLLETHKKAAQVFESCGCVLSAAQSYRLLLAKGIDSEKNSANLVKLFEDAGNSELARLVKTLI